LALDGQNWHSCLYYLARNDENLNLLLGNGQKYMIREIEYLRNFGNVHLGVLSACETGLGETNADGKEIQGISAYFTGARVKQKPCSPFSGMSTTPVPVN
jgi:CHAT domain-containing protein